MKINSGLRYYKNLVRIVKNGDKRSPYGIGLAYGNYDKGADATERRRRILDQWCLPNQSPRKPEPSDVGELYPTRAQTTLFHQLSADQQAMLTRRGEQAPLTRRAVHPGTKQRINLSNSNFTLEVNSLKFEID